MVSGKPSWRVSLRCNLPDGGALLRGKRDKKNCGGRMYVCQPKSTSIFLLKTRIDSAVVQAASRAAAFFLASLYLACTSCISLPMRSSKEDNRDWIGTN